MIYDHSGRIIVCGGGGASKTGVPNKLILLETATSEDLKAEGRSHTDNAHAASVLPARGSKSSNIALVRKVCAFDTGSDAIMNMALHPTENLLACGVGDRCRAYNVGYRNFQHIGEVQTDFAENEEDRGQKRVRFSPQGNFIFCAGGDGFVRMYTFPALQLVKSFAGHSIEKEKETIDLSVTGNMLVTLSRKKCLVYDIHTGSILHMMEPSDKKLSFRDARFCPRPTTEHVEDSSLTPPSSNLHPKEGTQEAKRIYDDGLDEQLGSASARVAEKTSSESSRSATFVPDAAYLYTTEFIPKQNGVVKKWDLKSWRPVKSKTIRFNSDHLTAFGISPDGSTLAIGTVEGQVRVLDSSSFSEVFKDATKHEFFVTDFAFDSALPALPFLLPSGGVSSSASDNPLSQQATRKSKNRVLYSTSGDNTLRATLIPNLAATGRRRSSACSIICYLTIFVILAVLALLVLVLDQIYRPEEVRRMWELADSYGIPSDFMAPKLQLIANQTSEWLEEVMSWTKSIQ